mgnify:CR=1 FL=1
MNCQRKNRFEPYLRPLIHDKIILFDVVFGPIDLVMRQASGHI